MNLHSQTFYFINKLLFFGDNYVHADMNLDIMQPLHYAVQL